MDKKKKDSLIRIFFLLIVITVIVMGIITHLNLGSTAPTEGWRAKAGAVFFLIVFLVLLIKEVRKLFS